MMPFPAGLTTDPDRHPTRPWWGKQRGYLCESKRTDGWVVGFDQDAPAWIATPPQGEQPAYRVPVTPGEAEAVIYAPHDALLATVDADHPLPTPPPRCGQVWMWPKTGSESTIIAVEHGSGTDIRTGERSTWATPIFAGIVVRLAGWYDIDDGDWRSRQWPPPEGILLAGPGSPWSPVAT
jgi:hypothetical protein